MLPVKWWTVFAAVSHEALQQFFFPPKEAHFCLSVNMNVGFLWIIQFPPTCENVCMCAHIAPCNGLPIQLVLLPHVWSLLDRIMINRSYSHNKLHYSTRSIRVIDYYNTTAHRKTKDLSNNTSFNCTCKLVVDSAFIWAFFRRNVSNRAL